MKLSIKCRSGLRIDFDGTPEELDRFDAFLTELADLERQRLEPGAPSSSPTPERVAAKPPAPARQATPDGGPPSPPVGPAPLPPARTAPRAGGTGRDGLSERQQALVSTVNSCPSPAVWSSRNEERMSDDTNLGRGLFHLLNGEAAHGLTIIQHDDEPPKATPTYMLNLNVGWADHIIAERMYLSDARGIAYLLADSLNCPVGDVEEPSRAA